MTKSDFYVKWQGTGGTSLSANGIGTLSTNTCEQSIGLATDLQCYRLCIRVQFTSIHYLQFVKQQTKEVFELRNKMQV